MKINPTDQTASLTILHNKEKNQLDEIELSPNIGTFTAIKFKPMVNVTYNFLGFTHEGLEGYL